MLRCCGKSLRHCVHKRRHFGSQSRSGGQISGETPDSLGTVRPPTRFRPKIFEKNFRSSPNPPETAGSDRVGQIHTPTGRVGADPAVPGQTQRPAEQPKTLTATLRSATPNADQREG
jgi:hypothetical protein